MKLSSKPRWYVGIAATSRIPFRSRVIPVETQFRQYLAVLGPFDTKRGAVYAAKHPGLADVGAYEKAASHA